MLPCQISPAIGQARQIYRLRKIVSLNPGLSQPRSSIYGKNVPGRRTHPQAAPAAASTAHNMTAAIMAWPWFQITFCQNPSYKLANTVVVPWQDFWRELHKLARSKGLNEVCWSFVDNKLSQPAQQQVFQANLWARVRPTRRSSITIGEFNAAVELFSPNSGGMADLIESIMQSTPGSIADTSLHLRDQIFLSHTGSDKQLGSVSLTSALYRELFDRLELLAFYDTHTLEPGDAWRHKLERCLQSSKVVVMMLSPSFMSRYWCMHELDLALHAEPGHRIILPVLLGVGHDVTEQPAKYRETWRGFRQLAVVPDAEKVLDRWEQNLRLLDELQPFDASPYATSSGKDWESKLARQIADMVQQQHHIAPALSLNFDVQQPQQGQCNVHFNLPEHNVVNSAAFERLKSSIEAACGRQGPATPPPVLQLLGMAGMGKSVLALQLAKHYEDSVGPFNGSVHFLRVLPKLQQADDQAAKNLAVMQLQHALLRQLQPSFTTCSTDSPDNLHRDLTRAFASPPLNQLTHLLVLDDVWDNAIIKQLRCSTMRGVILATARQPIRYDRIMTTSDQVWLTPDDNSRQAAKRLLGCILENVSLDDEVVVNAVLNKCDGNMLATAIMAQALAKQCWSHDVLERFSAILDSDVQLDDQGYSINQIIEASIQSVTHDQAVVLCMLKLLKCRLLLPLPLLQLAWDIIRPNEAPHGVSFLLGELVDRCLLCRSEDVGGSKPSSCSYYAHALVDEVLTAASLSGVSCTLPSSDAVFPGGCNNISSWVKACTRAASAPRSLAAAKEDAAVNKLAALLLGYGRDHAVMWAQRRVLPAVPADGRPIYHLGDLKDWAQSSDVDAFAVEPQGQLLSRVGQVCWKDGQYKTAEVVLRQALYVRQKVLGLDHPDIAESLNNLALLLQAQSKLSEAMPLHSQALGITQKVLGPEHQHTATALNNLAKLLSDQGKLTEAEPIFREALGIRQKVLGPEHPDTATILNNLALLLQAQGKLAEAEPLDREALGICQKVLGSEHQLTATSLNNLANLLTDQGKLTEAEPIFREALGIRQKVLGPEHPDTATILNNLASLLQAQGKLTEAEPLYRTALVIAQKVLGPEHPNTAIFLKNLVNLLRDQGKYAEAASLHTKALLGPDYMETAHPFNSLASF